MKIKVVIKYNNKKMKIIYIIILLLLFITIKNA